MSFKRLEYVEIKVLLFHLQNLSHSLKHPTVNWMKSNKTFLEEILQIHQQWFHNGTNVENEKYTIIVSFKI